MTLCSTASAKKATVSIRLVETTDVHGAFFPFDFTERRDMAGTMARASSWLKRQRQTWGDRLVLLDNGDILQGQPTSYYYNYVNTGDQNIAAEVINYLGYDAQTWGNHDIETGHAVYDKWAHEVNCPQLGANVIDLKSGKPYVEPYLILERQGVRIAVLGMLTPTVPHWLHESLWSGMRFDEMVTAARQWVKLLREKEEADVVVGLFHSGWEGGISTDDLDENATRKIAEQVDGFDVIFFGHDHQEHHSTTRRGTLCLNPANNARKLAVATLDLQRRGDGTWRVRRKHGELVDITKEPVDSDYMAHFQPHIDQVRAFVEQPVGTCADTLRANDSFFGPAPFTDYVHQTQLMLTGADISLAAPLTMNTVAIPGTLCIGDLFKLYRFENHLNVLRMTGAEVKALLEMSYDQWTNTMRSADDHIMRVDTTADGRTRFSCYTFNFDSAAGIEYVVDVSKPDSQKVHILQMADGRPFDEHCWYNVAMNSYRANGGGELLTVGAGISKDSIASRIVYTSEHDVRHYIAERLRQEHTLAPTIVSRWRFVPEAWAQPAIRRDRRLLFNE